MTSMRAFSGLPAGVFDYGTIIRDTKDLAVLLKSLDELYYGEATSPAVEGSPAEYGIKLRRRSQKYPGQSALSGLDCLLILIGARGLYNGKEVPPSGHWQIEPRFLAKDKFVAMWFYTGKTEEESFAVFTTHKSANDVEKYASEISAQYPSVRGAVLHEPGKSPSELNTSFYYLDALKSENFASDILPMLAFGAAGIVAVGAAVYFVKRTKK